jgi:beta-galactosidase
MEELGENFGFIHYTTHIPAFTGEPLLNLNDVNDYVHIWLDGKYLGSQYRTDEKKEFIIPGDPAGSTLELLVENTGRINYGPYVGKDLKGIAGSVCLNFQTLFGWHYDLLPLAQEPVVPQTPFAGLFEEPAVYQGEFELTETADTFLNRPGIKGVVWINGFNLGRYWAKGPTGTLYVPAPVLKKGKNRIVIFEQEKLLADTVTFSREPDLGPME